MSTMKIGGYHGTYADVEVSVTTDKDGFDFLHGRKPNGREAERIVARHARAAHRELTNYFFNHLRDDVMAKVGPGKFYNSLYKHDVRGGGIAYITEISSHDKQLARWLERGTGVYGPMRHKIYPVKGKYMKAPFSRINAANFPRVKKTKDGILFESIRGQPGRHFFRTASRETRVRQPLIEKKHAKAAAAELRIRKP